MEACLYLCVYSYCTVCEDYRFTCMYIYVHTYMHTCVVLYGVCQFCQEGVIISRNDASSPSRWPLIIDPHQQCATFLRYRDTNYMNALRQKDMNPNSIRRSIIGALRFAGILSVVGGGAVWEGLHESKEYRYMSRTVSSTPVAVLPLYSMCHRK